MNGGFQRFELVLEGLTKNYRNVSAVHGVSLVASAGIMAILGRNGAGKSTLVRMIVGVEDPTSGSLELRGIDSSDARGRRRVTGWLPQTFGYPSSMTVEEFVEYAAWLKEIPRGQRCNCVGEALEFADVQQVARRRLGRLSGGTLRRVGLASAVVHRPQLLVLDEPTTGLDPEQRDLFHSRLMSLRGETTVLMSTHLLEDVEVLAQSVQVMDEGRFVWSGNVADLAAEAPTGTSPGTTALRAGFLAVVNLADRP